MSRRGARRDRSLGATVAWLAVLLVCCLQSTSPVNAGPSVAAAGAYPEGLLWHDGKMLFAEMGADRISIIERDRTRPFWQDAGCGPTSIAPFGRSGYLVNCHLGGHVAEVSASGKTGRRFRTAPGGVRIQWPNASAADGQGGVFFSDSGVFSLDAPATGRVYRINPDGEITEVIRDLRYANGVAFDPASRMLYVSEHLARRILALQLDEAQSVVSSRVFADFSRHPAMRTHSYPLAGPDGIALRPGLLAVAEYGEGRVHLFDRGGRHLRTLKVAMPFVDTVAWDGEAALYAGGAFSNTQPPYDGRVVRFAPADWQPAR